MKPEDKKYILENIDKKKPEEIARELSIKERKVKRFLEKYRSKIKAKAPQRVIPTFKNKAVLFSMLLIIAAGFLAYSNSFQIDFIWDDEHLVVNNEYIKDSVHLTKFFTSNIGEGAGVKYSFYRPLQMLSYMGDYFVWKLQSAGFHFTNVLLHVLAALAVFWLVIFLFNDWLVALLTSLFFVVHPVHTEAVTYISGRADSLSLLFMLLCFIFYLHCLNAKNAKLYIFIPLTYLIAIFSRENSLILPILILLYHYSFKEKIKYRQFLPLLIIAFGYVILRLGVLRFIISGVPRTSTLFQRIPGFFVALTSYLKLLVWPINLHMEYGQKLFKFSNPAAIVGVIMFVVLLTYAFRKREVNQIIFFSISWFFIGLLPVSNLYPINAYMAEHWLYLPSIGLFLIFAKGLSFLFTKNEFKYIAAILTVFLLILYSWFTLKQNSYWKEPISFYKRTLKYAPDSYRVHYNLGNEYSDLNQREEAISWYKKTIEIKPDHYDAYFNMGNEYKSLQSYDEAIASYKQALAIDPEFIDAYNNLGVVYKKLGRNDEAQKLYKKAIKVNPDNPEIYNNLGVLYSSLNQKEKAIDLYKKAIEINPRYAKGYINLGNEYNALNRIDEAITVYKKAITIDPTIAQVYSNLAAAYFKKGEYKLALQYYDKAESLGYTNPKLLKVLEPYR
jgi:tetratricopeptide (TPR) repeat protein